MRIERESWREAHARMDRWRQASGWQRWEAASAWLAAETGGEPGQRMGLGLDLAVRDAPRETPAADLKWRIDLAGEKVEIGGTGGEEKPPLQAGEYWAEWITCVVDYGAGPRAGEQDIVCQQAAVWPDDSGEPFRGSPCVVDNLEPTEDLAKALAIGLAYVHNDWYSSYRRCGQALEYAADAVYTGTGEGWWHFSQEVAVTVAMLESARLGTVLQAKRTGQDEVEILSIQPDKEEERRIMAAHA